MPWPVKSVAELGPGDSIGTGLAALLTGAERYMGLDAYPFAGNQANVTIFEELVKLLEARTAIPDDREFPEVWPRLQSYAFPKDILTGEIMAKSLAAPRVEEIRKILQSGLKSSAASLVKLDYVAPWNSADLIEGGSVDLVISQAVMEHVAEVDKTYMLLRKWMRPDGWMSHTIGYKCHNYTRDWNGHWTVSRGTWKILSGKRRITLNRQAHSAHIHGMKAAGFQIVMESAKLGSALSRSELAPEFQSLTDADLVTSDAFVQARPVV